MDFKRKCYDPTLASSTMIRFGVTRAELRVAHLEMNQGQTTERQDNPWIPDKGGSKATLPPTQRTVGEPMPGKQSQTLPPCVGVGSLDVL